MPRSEMLQYDQTSVELLLAETDWDTEFSLQTAVVEGADQVAAGEETKRQQLWAGVDRSPPALLPVNTEVTEAGLVRLELAWTGQKFSDGSRVPVLVKVFNNKGDVLHNETIKVQ